MFEYEVYGLLLNSECEFPELRGDSTGRQERILPRIRFARSRESTCEPKEWLWQFPDALGSAWMAGGRISGGYLLRFEKVADYKIEPARGSFSLLCQGPDTSDETVRHLLLDQVLPFSLSLFGVRALHATAVRFHDGICAFAGDTGAGKSTLAAAFLKDGYPVVSDDCLVIEQHGASVLAKPSYAGVRLWPDSAANLGLSGPSASTVNCRGSKLRLAMPGNMFARELQPLLAIYSLGTAGSLTFLPRVEPLSFMYSVKALLSCSFRLDLSDREGLSSELVFLANVARVVPVRRLFAPRDFASLERTKAAILSDLDSLETS